MEICTEVTETEPKSEGSWLEEMHVPESNQYNVEDRNFLELRSEILYVEKKTSWGSDIWGERIIFVQSTKRKPKQSSRERGSSFDVQEKWQSCEWVGNKMCSWVSLVCREAQARSYVCMVWLAMTTSLDFAVSDWKLLILVSVLLLWGDTIAKAIYTRKGLTGALLTVSEGSSMNVNGSG